MFKRKFRIVYSMNSNPMEFQFRGLFKTRGNFLLFFRNDAFSCCEGKQNLYKEVHNQCDESCLRTTTQWSSRSARLLHTYTVTEIKSADSKLLFLNLSFWAKYLRNIFSSINSVLLVRTKKVQCSVVKWYFRRNLIQQTINPGKLMNHFLKT